MNCSDIKNSSCSKPGTSFLKAIGLTIPMLLMMALMVTGGKSAGADPLRLISLCTAYVLICGIFFLMIYTGRIDRYRSILFIILSLTFVISFMTELIETRGSIVLTRADTAQGHTPFCHMVIPQTIVPAALTRTIIFPGSMLEGFASIGSMLVLWLGVSLALGRAWCSWGCFFGGLDEAFSRLRKKPLIKNIDKRWLLLPFGILVAVILSSAACLTPMYCKWACPFKAVTEFAQVTTTETFLQAIIFYSLFVGLVIVLPLLMKKRAQCGLFCPMGAFQSLTNKVNIFDVRIDKDLCVSCGLCASVCPVFAMDKQAIEKGRPKMACSKCGACIERCPKNAISYYVKGTGRLMSRLSRMMFVYAAFLLLGIMSSGMIQSAVYRILLLATTGNMFKQAAAI
jgi:ferredoxin-type protein NapH